MSFFLNENKKFHNNDFYDIVRNVGADYVEQVFRFIFQYFVFFLEPTSISTFKWFQVKLTDEFFHPKKNRISRTYRIIYRHMDRPLTKIEVNLLHLRIANAVVDTFDVEIRQ